jgi:hypothetical protein
MRVKALISLAIVATIVALPVPASQLLAGSFSAPSPAKVLPGNENLRFLLQDPFLIDQMSYERPTSLFP